MLGTFIYTTHSLAERLGQGCPLSMIDYEIAMEQQLADFDYRMQGNKR
jgi:hypothetical protein